MAIAIVGQSNSANSGAIANAITHLLTTMNSSFHEFVKRRFIDSITNLSYFSIQNGIPMTHGFQNSEDSREILV